MMNKMPQKKKNNTLDVILLIARDLNYGDRMRGFRGLRRTACMRSRKQNKCPCHRGCCETTVFQTSAK